MQEKYSDKELRVLTTIFEMSEGQAKKWILLDDLEKTLQMSQNELYPILKNLEERKGLIESLNEAVWIVPAGIEKLESRNAANSSSEVKQEKSGKDLEFRTVSGKFNSQNVETLASKWTLIRAEELDLPSLLSNGESFRLINLALLLESIVAALKGRETDCYNTVNRWLASGFSIINATGEKPLWNLTAELATTFGHYVHGTGNIQKTVLEKFLSLPENKIRIAAPDAIKFLGVS